MGKDFMPLRQNGLDWLKALKLLDCVEVKEASKDSYFSIKPKPYEVKEVELGTDGTNETILRLWNRDFVVLEGTLPVEDL